MMRRHMKVAALAAAMFVVVPTAVQAEENYYITDSLSVGVFSSPDLSGNPAQRILTGSSVTLLERGEGIARVRTHAGTEGWIRSTFLASEPPAVIKLEQTIQELDQVQEALAEAEKKNSTLAEEVKNLNWVRGELKKVRAQAAQAQEQVGTLKEGAESNQGEVAQLQQSLEELKAHNADLQTRLAASELIIHGEEPENSDAGQVSLLPSVPLVAFAIAVLLAAVGGFASGYRWLDKRVRARFGGIRIY